MATFDWSADWSLFILYASTGADYQYHENCKLIATDIYKSHVMLARDLLKAIETIFKFCLSVSVSD